MSVLYHRLCQSPHKQLPAALNGFIEAFGNQRTFAYDFAKKILQAGEDSEVMEVQKWGELLIKGMNARKKNDVEATIEMFTSLLKTNYVTTLYRAVSLAWRGYFYSQRQIYPQALVDLDEAIHLAPESVIGWKHRADIYTELRRYEEAVADFSQAIALDTNMVIFSMRGFAYIRLDRYEEAVADFTEAITHDPIAPALNLRGFAYIKLDRYEEAVADFTEAIRLDPSAEAFVLRGSAYTRLKSYEEAVADFTEVIRLDPSAEAFQRRGDAYIGLDRYEEGIADFTEVIRLNPSAEVFQRRGDAYKGLKCYKEYLADLKQAFILDKTLNDTLDLTLGLAFSYNGQYADAIDIYEKSLKEDPNNYRSLYNRAVVIARWKGLTIALPYIDKARGALNSSTNIQDNYAILYGNGGIEALLGNVEDALDYLQKAIALDKEAIDWARHDVAWFDFHSHPRFLALIT